MTGNDRDERIDALLAEYMRQVDAGVADREAFLEAHPDDAETLQTLLLTEDTVLRLAGPVEADVDPLAPTQAMPAPGAAPGDDPPGDPPPSPSDDETARASPLPFGNYQLLELLGRGGMGVVYRARQKGLERDVALKMILNAHLASDEEIQRFYTEAKAAAAIHHHHVVDIHEIGEVDGQHFFSMELVDGTDLARMIKEGRLESRRAALLLRDAARAVQAAHDEGVLHRDIKPANILVDVHDRVVVTDFGLAKEIEQDTHLTATGLAMGTPSYMSPEQASGKRERMGMSSDVYSLGAVLFAMLTGRPPHRGDNVMDTLVAVMHQPARHPAEFNSDAHPALCRVCLKCLEKDPQRRYESAAGLADDLDRFLAGETVDAQGASPLAKAAGWFARIPIVAALRGRPTPHPTRGQLRAQAALMLAVLLAAVLAVTLPRVRHFMANRLPEEVRVAGGMAGGAFDQFAAQLADKITSSTPCRADTIQTTGSGDNLQLLLDGQAQLALLQEALLGSDEVVVVAPLFEEAVYVVVRRDRVSRWEQLDGAVLAVGGEGTGMAEAAADVLAGLNSVTLRHVDFRRLAEDPSLDGAVITIARSSSSLHRLLADPAMAVLPLPKADAERLARDPQFRRYTIRTQDGREIPSVATPAFLACRRDAPQSLVTETLQVLYPADAPSHAHDIEQAWQWRALSMHPTAHDYFEKEAAK